MSPNQKAARLNLTVIGVTLLAYLITVQLLAWSFGHPWFAVTGPASGVFGLFGLTGFARFYYRSVPGRSAMMDERDRLIEERSRFIGFTTFWVVWVIGSVGAWAALRYVAGRETISVDTLPMLVLAGWLVFLLAQSIAILTQYGRSGHDGTN
jgi:hypothetical protein